MSNLECGTFLKFEYVVFKLLSMDKDNHNIFSMGST